MPSLFAAWPTLFAQAAPAARPDASIWTTVATFLPVIVLFYFMMIRPQAQQERQRRQMLQALKKNDKVLTESGIFGTVVSIDADSDKVVLRVDDDRGVKMTFLRSKIARVLDAAAEKDKDRDKDKEKEKEKATESA
jgi:preprotein translocase subunit YajC